MAKQKAKNDKKAKYYEALHHKTLALIALSNHKANQLERVEKGLPTVHIPELDVIEQQLLSPYQDEVWFFLLHAFFNFLIINFIQIKN